VLMKPFTNGVKGGAGCRYGLGETGDAGYSILLNESPDDEGGGDMGTNPATGLMILIGWGA
jgi:hypothetical protein